MVSEFKLRGLHCSSFELQTQSVIKYIGAESPIKGTQADSNQSLVDFCCQS